MSAIARYFLAEGTHVGGYDRVRSKVSIALEEAGAEIIYEDKPELIPDRYRSPREVQVVYTPAIHEDNHIRQYYAQHDYEQVKRAVVLGQITVSYTHLTLPTILRSCRSRWSPYH